MIRFPNAKINLGLNIVSKRPDGYHNLETIFYPIGIKDALEVVVSSGHEDTFTNSGIAIDGPSDKNLVMKVLKLMREFADFPFVDIYLHKVIPFGAGLGGGSADAAAMLLLLDDLFSLNLGEEKLLELASRLGADCAFFIKDRPVFATGIGNIFQEIDFSLSGNWLVLVKPPIHVSTPDAYAMVKPQLPYLNLTEIVQDPITEWQNLMMNDFEKSVFAKFPAIDAVKQTLIKQGARYASMSGSGSSVFGLFEQKPQLSPADFPDCYFWCEQLG
ncbi:MAG: 4-(cytidine 5'-diphospho)-2-C-methyl-D-erythritol kinase [Bacteroidales bacterium]